MQGLIAAILVLNGFFLSFYVSPFLLKREREGRELVSVGLIMILVWPYSKVSSLLLLPYLLWVSFATYLTYDIYTMNQAGH